MCLYSLCPPHSSRLISLSDVRYWNYCWAAFVIRVATISPAEHALTVQCPDELQGGLKLPPIRSQEELTTALTKLGSLRPDQVRKVSSSCTHVTLTELECADVCCQVHGMCSSFAVGRSNLTGSVAPHGQVSAEGCSCCLPGGYPERLSAVRAGPGCGGALDAAGRRRLLYEGRSGDRLSLFEHAVNVRWGAMQWSWT